MVTFGKRVVTGLNAEGRSTIISADAAPGTFTSERRSMQELWAVERLPAPLDEPRNAADTDDYTLEPAPGGACFRIIATRPQAGHGPMHATATLDLIVVLAGELRLIMEEGDVLLQPGDVVIQRGTQHAWSNDGDQECIIAGVLLSTDAG
jgi:quercetin dioxygenase-like cupin family protein